jgi:hypothetical protein
MSNRIQLRRDSTYNWNNINPILADGEPGLDYDTNKIKIGDGSSYWSDLPWATNTLPSLATVATTGSYTDLDNRPTNLFDILGGASSLDNRRFLRLNFSESSIEYSSDFRVVPFSNVVYPAGTIGQDKVGDVAFSSGAIYYCVQEPNSYTVTWQGDSFNPWVPDVIALSNIGGSQPTVGAKLTDGTHTAVVTEVIAWWDGSRTGLRISPTVNDWHTGTGTLTVFTGDAPSTHIWAKIGSELVSAPSTLTSPGIVGQMAYDSNYIYRCTQTNVSEISSVYSTPHSYNGGGNQNAGSSMMNVLDAGGVPAPQVGWIISDGSSQRTITNVVRQNSAWGYIYTLTFSGGDINWNTLNSITIISQPAVSGQWVKAKWFSGSYNDLTDKPTTVVDVNQLTDTHALLDKEPKFNVQYQNFNALSGTRYCIDAVGQAVTATLPASPDIGDAIYFVDAYGQFDTHNLTINGNGNTIMGASTQVISTANESIGVFYNGSEWRFYG